MMRHLRMMINKAVSRKIIAKELYPFDEYKISKLKRGNNKIAMSLEDYRKFKSVDLSESPHLIEAYNYFIFSFLTRGMNLHDMMLLRWSDIRNGRIFYVRAKTKVSFSIEILPAVQQILDHYKAQNRNTPYVFPILLSDDLTPQQIAYRKHKVISRYNKKLKEIAKLAGIEQELTSYVARHSYATILKQLGASTDLISESMGHSNVSVTENYLKEFSTEVLDETNKKLLEL